MQVTFNEYIKNPMGGKTSVFSARDLYHRLYSEKMALILLREQGKINYTVYSKGTSFVIHMKIPSEIVPEFYYDTVVEFFPPEGSTVEMDKAITNYHVNFFSNDPSFVFTFAYSFVQNELFIKDLSPKMSKLALTKAAVVRNPKNEVGYVKSLFFFYLIMKRENLFNKSVLLEKAKNYNKKQLIDSIEHADLKIKSRQEEGTKISRKIKEKITSYGKGVDRTQSNKAIPSTKQSKSSTGVKKTQTVNKTKKTKSTKRI